MIITRQATDAVCKDVSSYEWYHMHRMVVIAQVLFACAVGMYAMVSELRYLQRHQGTTEALRGDIHSLENSEVELAELSTQPATPTLYRW